MLLQRWFQGSRVHPSLAPKLDKVIHVVIALEAWKMSWWSSRAFFFPLKFQRPLRPGIMWQGSPHKGLFMKLWNWSLGCSQHLHDVGNVSSIRHLPRTTNSECNQLKRECVLPAAKLDGQSRPSLWTFDMELQGWVFALLSLAQYFLFVSSLLLFGIGVHVLSDLRWKYVTGIFFFF